MNLRDRFLSLIKQAEAGGKVERLAFLYLDPKDPKDRFAQCSSCMMWTGADHKTCTIHGKDVTVTGDMSCGLYVHGDPMPDEAGHEMKSVTPEESGLVERPVRCENCKFFETPATCGLYVQLDKSLPELFDLDAEVDPQGCCNAQLPK